MNGLYDDRSIIRIENPEWRAGTKECFKLKGRKRKCGLNAYGSCVSSLTQHTCKHLIHENKRGKEALIKLSDKQEFLRDRDNLTINCKETAVETHKSNPCIQEYERISSKSLQYIDYGVISKGNYSLFCTGDYDGFNTILNQDHKILSFYRSNRLSEDRYSYFFFSILKNICRSEKSNEYKVPQNIPQYVPQSINRMQGTAWLKYCPLGDLGLEERINFAFGECPDKIKDPQSLINNYIFHFWYSAEDSQYLDGLSGDNAISFVEDNTFSERIVFRMMQAHHSLDTNGRKWLSPEEKHHSKNYGLDDKGKNIVTSETWKRIYDLQSNAIDESINNIANTYFNTFSSQKDKTTDDMDMDLIKDMVAQNICQDIYNLRTLAKYAGEDIPYDHQVFYRGDSVLNDWKQFYSFLWDIQGVQKR